MKPPPKKSLGPPRARAAHALEIVLVSALMVVLAGCDIGREEGAQVAGWSLVDPAQRHPILVSKQPTTVSMIVPPGSHGLAPHQRAQLVRFLERYQTTDAGNSKLVIQVPRGAANEAASMQALTEIRHLMAAIGVNQSLVSVEGAHEPKHAQGPIRVSYLRYVAEAPQCGDWPTNLAYSPANLNFPNMGCANQRNFAAMVANPADLVEPRTMTPNSSERRGVIWEKYTKGQSTVSQKQDEEKVKVQGQN